MDNPTVINGDSEELILQNQETMQQAPQKTAADWFRDMRFNPDVNNATVAADTDHVTPQLLLNTANKLLDISRGKAQPDPKDSLAFQRFYGPAEYFAQHIQRDGGKLARNLLWKATNKGNLDFIPTGALNQHVNSVFYESNLAQYIDGSTPFEAVDDTFKTTRVGEGGIASADSAPDEMRTVQASYFGFVDPVRSQERAGCGLSGYLTKNVMKGTDGKLYQKFINARTGKEEYVDSVKAANSVVASSEVMADNTKSVYALGGKTGVRIVDRKDVDYILPRPDDAYSTGSNMVTMLDSIKEMRLLMGCLHPATPILWIDGNGHVHMDRAAQVTAESTYMTSCSSTGQDKILRLGKSVPRFTDKQKCFYKIVLSSGRTLITSSQHRWSIIESGKLADVKATELTVGMQVPRSLFRHMPVINQTVLGVQMCSDLAVLLGRVQRSIDIGKSKKYFRITIQEQQKDAIVRALGLFGKETVHPIRTKNGYFVTINNKMLREWIIQNVGPTKQYRRVPSCVLSADTSNIMTFLDSYSKQLDNVGMDTDGDVWLLDIDNELVRESLAYLFARIYTDTIYKDVTHNGRLHLSLKLVPIESTFGDCTIDTITHIGKIAKTPMMIDFDLNDDVYACGNGIITHNSKYATQAVPLVERQVPLVQSLDRATNKPMEELIGKKLGTQWASKPGVVTAVRRDRIDLAYDDGTKGSVGLYVNFPANIKGFLHNRPVVKAGDKVASGQLLAASNFTDDKGVEAMGRNLRVGYISYKGGTYEDACAVSQSCAKKMTSRVMYKTAADIDKNIRTSKNLYTMWKPKQFTKQQLQTLDSDGMVKPGTVVHKGDPMFLAIQTVQPSPGTLGKRILNDKSQIWQHDHPGTITDVVKTRSGIKIYATADAPLQIGDKLSPRYGNKGTVAQIIPDQMMPKDSKGRPLDILMSPLGIVSRTNPAQLYETQLGKIAQKLGHPIQIPEFSQGDKIQFIKKLSKQYHVPLTDDVYDPDSGRTLKGILTGNQYTYKLKHMAQSKMSARGTEGYNSQGIPSQGGQQGSKRFGVLESIAMIGHNSFDTLVTDAKLIRGQNNADFWRQIRTGQIPTIPGEPLVHKKFFAHLQGSGIRVRKTDKGISVFSLTNKDVEQLAGPRQVKSRDTYQSKNFRPIDGGLFGTDIFGQNGDKWGYIKLDEPVLNPVMQQPIARLLNLSDKQLQAVLMGDKELNGKTGSPAVYDALKNIDLHKQRANALQELKEASVSKKDKALKRYVAIARMDNAGNKPTDYMLDKIPVLPPQFRPITSAAGMTMVADSNYLYAQLIDARDDMRDAKGLPEQYQKAARKNLYKKWNQLVGLYDPQDIKLQSKSVKGLLKWALGDSPKQSAWQRKVFGSTVDTVGRGVVVPDSKLKLNQVGLPQPMAWGIFSPFVNRALVNSGYSPVDALAQVKNKTPLARQYLMKVMADRPVMMNRAPSLHKLSIMGFNPVLVSGHAIHVNPSIVSPFGMDFDGDSCKSLISIDLAQNCMPQFECVRKNEDFLKQSLTNTNSVLQYTPEQQDKHKGVSKMFKEGTEITLISGCAELNELPTVPGSEVKRSATVTEWDVAPGIYANTVDPATGKITHAPITKVSKHQNLVMYDVTYGISASYQHMVTVSEDHSLITLNPESISLEKSKPVNSKGLCAPVARANVINRQQYCMKEAKFPSGKYPMSHELGLFLGLMIGDGWITETSSDSTYCCHIDCCDESLQSKIAELTKRADMPFTKEAGLFSYEASEGRFSDSNMQRFTLYMTNEDKCYIRDLIGQGAENKRIPRICYFGSKAHMIGLLMGLLATDGSVSHNPPTGSKKSSVKHIAYHTTSPVLRDGIQEICHRLGIKTSATQYTGTTSNNTAYMINFCIEDVARLYDKNTDLVQIPVDYKQEALVRIVNDVHENSKASCNKAVTSYDIVPFPRGLFCEFSWAKIVDLAKDQVIAARAKGFIKRSTAKRIADAMERRDWAIYKTPTYIKKEDRTNRTPEQAKAMVDKWIAIVRDESIGWAVVEDVQPSTCTEGWDCTVPGPYTFALADGTIVQDTVNMHAPVSKRAVEQVRRNMFPQRNLIGLKDTKILYPPQKEYIQGLYFATRMKQNAPVKQFQTLKQARDAYRAGTLDIDDPIIIKNK